MAGWKDWQPKEVVEESDFQSFIQDQVVQVYDDATDRDNTLGTAVAEGMFAYLKDTDETVYYDGSSWQGISNPGDITSVVAGTALTGGGTSGDVTLDVDTAAVGSAITITASQLSDVTATATELNYVDGVTSGIQSQLDGKVDESDGSVTQATAGSAVVRNITLSTATPGTADGSDGDVWLVYTP